MSKIRRYPRQRKYFPILTRFTHFDCWPLCVFLWRFCLPKSISIRIDCVKNVTLAKPIHLKHILSFDRKMNPKARILWIKYSITISFSQFMMYEIRVEAKLSNKIKFVCECVCMRVSLASIRMATKRQTNSGNFRVKTYSSFRSRWRTNRREKYEIERESGKKDALKSFWFNVLAVATFDLSLFFGWKVEAVLKFYHEPILSGIYIHWLTYLSIRIKLRSFARHAFTCKFVVFFSILALSVFYIWFDWIQEQRTHFQIISVGI